MKKVCLVYFIFLSLFLSGCFGTLNVKTSDNERNINYNELTEQTATIELDNDSNDAIDILRGGTNATTEAGARTTLGLVIGTDILAEQTIGIVNDNLIEVDGTPNDDEYVRFTANGLEGRTESEFKSDFNLESGTDFYNIAGADAVFSKLTDDETITGDWSFNKTVMPAAGIYAPIIINANYASGGGVTTLPWGIVSNYSVDGGTFNHGGAILGYVIVEEGDVVGTYYGIEGRADMAEQAATAAGMFSFGALTGDCTNSTIYGSINRASAETGYITGGVGVGSWSYSLGAGTNINAIFGNGSTSGDNATVQFKGYVGSGVQTMSLSVNDIIDAVFFDIDGQTTLTGYTFRLNDNAGASAFKITDSDNVTALSVDSNGGLLVNSITTTIDLDADTIGGESADAFQDLNSYLTDIAGLTPVANNLIGWNTGATDIENKSQLTLQFIESCEWEGATANEFETIMTVIDPTADRTYTLRDASGTVIISGDAFTGEVTGTFDTDGSTVLTIADDAVNSDEIADGAVDLVHLSTGAKFTSIAVAGLSDITTPSVLTTTETTNSCISNYKATGADHVFTMCAAHAAGNIIFPIGDEFQVDIEPNTDDIFYLNGTAMAANEHIQNTTDTLGQRIVGYCVNINGTLRWMFYSSDAAWVEETP